MFTAYYWLSSRGWRKLSPTNPRFYQDGLGQPSRAWSLFCGTFRGKTPIIFDISILDLLIFFSLGTTIQRAADRMGITWLTSSKIEVAMRSRLIIKMTDMYSRPRQRSLPICTGPLCRTGGLAVAAARSLPRAISL